MAKESKKSGTVAKKSAVKKPSSAANKAVKKNNAKKTVKSVAPKKESVKKTAPNKTPAKPLVAANKKLLTPTPHVKIKMPVKEDKPVIAPKAKVNTPGSVIVPPDYRPRDKEEFMNPVMLEYFKLKLLRWKAELVREAENTVHDTLQGTELQKPDLVDRASEETDHALELRTRDRERKLISKIDEALLRIEDGTYGYCEETGEPISVGRLDARPIATLSLEAQERHERKERTQRDD